MEYRRINLEVQRDAGSVGQRGPVSERKRVFLWEGLGEGLTSEYFLYLEVASTVW